MKNKIIKTALISLLLTSSINLISASENTFYLKPYVSGVMGDKMTNTNLDPTVEVDLEGVDTATQIGGFSNLRNIYSEYGANLGIAAGYNILEHVRVEAELSYINNIEYKGSSEDPDTKPTMLHNGWATYLNGYVDIVNTGPVRFFLSAGIGSSYMETEVKDHLQVVTNGLENLKNAYKDAVKTLDEKNAAAAEADGAGKAAADAAVKEAQDDVDEAKEALVEPNDVTYEQEMDFAYNLGLGVSFELNENYLLDVSYKYNNYGKPGSDADDTEWAYDSRASHNINLGLRFNL